MKMNESKDIINFTKKISWKKAAFFSISVLLLFFFYNVFENVLFLVAGVGVLVFSLFFLNCEELLLVVVILTPSVQMLKIIGYELAIHSYFLLTVEFKYILLQKGLKIKTSLFYVFFFISGIVTVLRYFDINLFLSLVRTVMFFVMIYSMNSNGNGSKNFTRLCIDFYIYGTSANVVLGILYYLILNKNIYWGYFAGINNDRNYFSTIIAISIALIVLEVGRYSLKEFISKMGVLAVILYAGIVSSSRTFMLSLAWVALMAFLLIFKRAEKKRNMLFLCFSAIVVLVLFKDEFLPIVQSVLERFSDDTVVGGNGRFKLWTEYLNLTFSTPMRTLFGNGSAINYVNEGIIPQIEHGTAIQLVSTVGVVGAILMIFCYLITYKKMFWNYNVFRYLVAYIPLLVSLTCNFNISALFLAHFDISVFVCMLAVLSFNNDVFFNDKNEISTTLEKETL